MNMMDVDIPVFGAFYCLMMIIVGQFFLMNLILAVIIFAFIKTQKKELEVEINELHGEDGNGNPLATSIISAIEHDVISGDGSSKRIRSHKSLARLNSKFSKKSLGTSTNGGNNPLKSSHRGILLSEKAMKKR